MLPTLASCLAGPTFTFSSSHPWRLCPASQKPEVRLLIHSTDMLTRTTHLRALCVFALLRGPAPACPPRWIATSHASQRCCPGPNLRPSPGKVPEAAVHDGRGMRTWVVHWRRDSHRRHRCLVWWSKHLFRHSARAGRGRTTFCALALRVLALRRHPRPPKCICSPRHSSVGDNGGTVDRTSPALCVTLQPAQPPGHLAFLIASPVYAPTHAHLDDQGALNRPARLISRPDRAFP